jgi:hypothetical protein
MRSIATPGRRVPSPAGDRARRAAVRRMVGMVAALGAASWMAACGPAEQRDPNEYRAFSDSFSYRIKADPAPPHARERTRYTIVVRDKQTGQPVSGGQGRVFATNRDRATVWDGFASGPEVGTYHANLNYLTAGLWAVALEFRRDSTQRLDRVDWSQEVRKERPFVP